MKIIQLSAVAATLLFAGSALAASPADANHMRMPKMHSQANQIDDPEFTFLQKLHASNQTEIRMGRIALQRASDQKVKDYANDLIRDHQGADGIVMARLHEKGWSFSGQKPIETAADKAELDAKMLKLKSLSGAEFDKTFLTDMVEDHDKDLPVVADFKEKTGDKAFHDQLQTIFDKMKTHRERAWTLLHPGNEIQNTSGTDQPNTGVDNDKDKGTTQPDKDKDDTDKDK